MINFVLFQLLWFASVLGGGRYSEPLLVLAGGLPLVVWALCGNARRELMLLGVFALSGLAIDSVWIAAGLFTYPDATVLPPYWIVMLWCGVAMTVDHSMRWFRDRPLVGGIAAGLAAPMSYVGGASLGAGIEIVNPILLPALSCSWALLFWALFTFARATDTPAAHAIPIQEELR